MSNEKLELKKIIPIATAASFFISCLYIKIFWVHFGIDIFNELSASEILIRSITPISLSILVIVVALVMHIAEENRPEGEKPTIPRIEIGKNKFHNTLAFILLHIPLAASFFVEPPLDIPLKFTTLTLATVFIVGFFKFHLALYSSTSIPPVLLMIFIFVTGSTIASAILDSRSILDGHNYQEIIIRHNENTETSKKIYIGRTQTTIYTWSPEKEEVEAFFRNKIDGFTITDRKAEKKSTEN